MNLVLALILSLPVSAESVSNSCELPAIDAVSAVTYDFTPGENGGATVTSRLTVGGQSIPALRTSCYFKNVPGERGYLCAHQGQGTPRYDVYPVFEKNQDGAWNGRVKKLVILSWAEDGSFSSYETESCSR